jgi:non-specific serine/threonine protein kinase
VKRLQAGRRVVLTGTPVENRLGDLWSIFDFLNPGLLGSATAFDRFTKGLATRPADRYGPLRRLVAPYILRRLKSDPAILPDLPPRTEVHAPCGLTKRQAALYQDTVSCLQEGLVGTTGIQRRGQVLALMLRLQQICNHPSQWLGDDVYDPEDSGKLRRLRELCEVIAARQEKVLGFTRFRELTGPLVEFLATIFGRPGLVLHGGTPVRRRRQLVETFAREDGPPCFVLSLKAGGTGLNLAAANHVIHFDRWRTRPRTGPIASASTGGSWCRSSSAGGRSRSASTTSCP